MHTDLKTYRHTHRCADTDTHGLTYRHAHAQAQAQAEAHAHAHTHKHTHTHTPTHTHTHHKSHAARGVWVKNWVPQAVVPQVFDFVPEPFLL